VPHNLISTQGSPVPLLKFQMAPRLKILKASRPKKESRYTLLVSQKSRQMNPLQVPQQGPYREGGPLTGHFAYLSKTPSFEFPSKGALPPGPSQSDVPSLEPSNISSRVPSEGAPPPRPPLWSLFRERDASSTEPPVQMVGGTSIAEVATRELACCTTRAR